MLSRQTNRLDAPSVAVLGMGMADMSPPTIVVYYRWGDFACRATIAETPVFEFVDTVLSRWEPETCPEQIATESSEAMRVMATTTPTTDAEGRLVYGEPPTQGGES